jgi:hypothetical protein
MLDYPSLREQMWELQAMLYEETNKKYPNLTRITDIENEIYHLHSLILCLRHPPKA